MRIGIDCRTILDPQKGEAAGVGHYTYHLVDNLLKIDKKNQYILLFDQGVGDAGYFKRKNSLIKFFPSREYKKFLPVVYSHLLCSAVLEREKLDVFHSPASTIPLCYSKNAIITVHDLAIYQNPKWFPRQIFATRVSVPQSLKKAKKIIAVSKHTGADLQKFLKVPKEKIAVVYNGVEARKDLDEVLPQDRQEICRKFGIKQNFILFIGTLQPRKNVEGLILAFDKLRNSEIFKNYQLVIAGKRGWGYKPIFEKTKKLTLTKKVIFCDYVSLEDKIRLLNAASVFVFPSFYEGFGLSILEAMRQGTPVITSNITSMPEIAGRAGYLIDPYKINSIAKGIKEVLTNQNLRQRMIRAGYAQAKKFSWEKCARETLKIYK
ncbi:MAG: glycosyltransferase family 1 protein [Patescibacteria group bacterium]